MIKTDDTLIDILNLVSLAYWKERNMRFCSLSDFNERVDIVANSMVNFSEDGLKDEVMRMYPHYIHESFEDTLAAISLKIDDLMEEHGISEEDFKYHKQLRKEYEKRKKNG